jgi:HEAT repeat protein
MNKRETEMEKKGTTILLVSFFLFSVAPFVIGADIGENTRKLGSSQRSESLAAVRELASLGTDEATAVLTNYLKTAKDDYVRIQIIEMLAENQSPVVTRALISSARDPNPYVRKAAVRSLGFQSDTLSLPELKRVLADENDAGVKKFAVSALGQHTSSAAVEAAGNVLSDRKNNKDLRILAAHSLHRMNTKEANSTLEKYKNDADADVKDAVNATVVVDKTRQKKGK